MTNALIGTALPSSAQVWISNTKLQPPRYLATLIAENSFDLIFIDYRLPDGTGIEALLMVHMSAQNKNAATIMITGQAQAEIAQEAIDKGCQDYLSNGDLCAPSFARTVQNALQKPHFSRHTPTGTLKAIHAQMLKRSWSISHLNAFRT